MNMGNKDLDRNAEELSALMDGEVSELELRRVLNSIEQDQALCRKWSRYQLASAVLRRQTAGQARTWMDIDLSARVQQAIEQEPSLLPASGRGKKPVTAMLAKPFANVAVAASVSAAVILGWQNFTGGPSQGAPAVASSAASMAPVAVSGNSPLMAVSQTSASGNPNLVMQPEMIRFNPELDDRLNYYLLSHSSNAAVNTASGVTPYARVVTVKPAQKDMPRTDAGQ
ncbi:MAG: sigma-E factor negative regulatory protein [Ketobacter sp.]|nr:sigma-E factor negative regulatory protein [Ketobacter sp.]